MLIVLLIGELFILLLLLVGVNAVLEVIEILNRQGGQPEIDQLTSRLREQNDDLLEANKRR